MSLHHPCSSRLHSPAETVPMQVPIFYSRNGIFFTDEPTVVLRKFPAVELSLPERVAGRFPMYFNANTGFAAISRRDGSITTPAFVERFDLYPSIEIPLLRSSLADLSQRISVRETFYSRSRASQLVSTNALDRLAFDYSSNFVGPELERDFGSWP